MADAATRLQSYYEFDREIARLTAENARMREALEPFAEIPGEGDEDFSDETKVWVRFGRSTHYALRLGDLRRARAALSPATAVECCRGLAPVSECRCEQARLSPAETE